jgi:hypothetical protein
MKRLTNPPLSALGEVILAQYRQVLHEQEDLVSASRRNYLIDLRHFATWYEAHCTRSTSDTASFRAEFDPQAITTPTRTSYRGHLQKDLRQKPSSECHVSSMALSVIGSRKNLFSNPLLFIV